MAPLPLCRQDVPIEYSGEEQAIVAVGLARPKPGVFVEAIQHLLVLCTTTEVGGQGSKAVYAGQRGRGAGGQAAWTAPHHSSNRSDR